MDALVYAGRQSPADDVYASCRPRPDTHDFYLLGVFQFSDGHRWIYLQKTSRKCGISRCCRDYSRYYFPSWPDVRIRRSGICNSWRIRLALVEEKYNGKTTDTQTRSDLVCLCCL